MRIRKFNESSASGIDAEYIRQCFADLIDSGVADFEERETAAYGSFTIIKVNLKRLSPQIDGIVNSKPELVSGNTSIMKYIETYDYNNNVYQEIKVSLDRLADEYPDYKIKVEIYSILLIYIYL